MNYDDHKIAHCLPNGAIITVPSCASCSSECEQHLWGPEYENHRESLTLTHDKAAKYLFLRQALQAVAARGQEAPVQAEPAGRQEFRQKGEPTASRVAAASTSLQNSAHARLLAPLSLLSL